MKRRPTSSRISGALGPPAEGAEPDPRWSLANERTLLAYMRTALSLLVAGLAVAASETVTDAPPWLAALGLPLITMAALVSVSAKRRFVAVQQAMRMGQPLPVPALVLILPWGVASVAAVGLVLMGVALASS